MSTDRRTARRCGVLSCRWVIAHLLPRVGFDGAGVASGQESSPAASGLGLGGGAVRDDVLQEPHLFLGPGALSREVVDLVAGRVCGHPDIGAGLARQGGRLAAGAADDLVGCLDAGGLRRGWAAVECRGHTSPSPPGTTPGGSGRKHRW
ncbi:hypothetical protein ACQP0I_06675 [Micromonospora carbonacea]|uniref:hypothetical protein n=1 Tax=Micromonospora carbonacea TaxID=47853 RepID=UPI003D9773FE